MNRHDIVAFFPSIQSAEKAREHLVDTGKGELLTLAGYSFEV